MVGGAVCPVVGAVGFEEPPAGLGFEELPPALVVGAISDYMRYRMINPPIGELALILGPLGGF
jgi:hypothetical protein